MCGWRFAAEAQGARQTLLCASRCAAAAFFGHAACEPLTNQHDPRKTHAPNQQDRTVFPITLVVTKISGSGGDSVFLGVLRTTNTDDANRVKVWATPSGQILCADQRFSDWFGVTPADLVGKPFSSLGTDIEALEKCVACFFV